MERWPSGRKAAVPKTAGCNSLVGSNPTLFAKRKGEIMHSREFTDTVLLESVIRDIRRYQNAYIKVNNVDGVMVKWKKGWFAIYNPNRAYGVSFHRPTSFRNMTDALEQRVKEKKEEEIR